jgi:hypothetical protein
MSQNGLPPVPPNLDELRSIAALHNYYQALRPSPSKRIFQVMRDFAFFMPLLIAVLFVFEFLNPLEYKPSTILGSWVGNEEAAKLRNQLEAAQQTLAAQNRENEKMQEAVERFKMDLFTVQNAYATSYQRINEMAGKMADMQVKNFEMQQQFAAKLETGKATSAMMLEMYAPFLKMLGLGNAAQNANQTAAQLKEQAMEKVREQASSSMADAQKNIDQWLSGLPRPDEIIRADREAPLRPEPYAAPPSKQPFYAVPRESAPALKQAERGAEASAQRLARVNEKHPNVFVRSTPKGGKAENKLCVLPQGAVVALLEDGGFDPDTNIMFAHVRFNWQERGVTSGWISAAMLNEFRGSERDAKAPQTCELPTS